MNFYKYTYTHTCICICVRILLTGFNLNEIILDFLPIQSDHLESYVLISSVFIFIPSIPRLCLAALLGALRHWTDAVRTGVEGSFLT